MVHYYNTVAHLRDINNDKSSLRVSTNQAKFSVFDGSSAFQIVARLGASIRDAVCAAVEAHAELIGLPSSEPLFKNLSLVQTIHHDGQQSIHHTITITMMNEELSLLFQSGQAAPSLYLMYRHAGVCQDLVEQYAAQGARKEITSVGSFLLGSSALPSPLSLGMAHASGPSDIVQDNLHAAAASNAVQAVRTAYMNQEGGDIQPAKKYRLSIKETQVNDSLCGAKARDAAAAAAGTQVPPSGLIVISSLAGSTLGLPEGALGVSVGTHACAQNDNLKGNQFGSLIDIVPEQGLELLHDQEGVKQPVQDPDIGGGTVTIAEMPNALEQPVGIVSATSNSDMATKQSAAERVEPEQIILRGTAIMEQNGAAAGAADAFPAGTVPSANGAAAKAPDGVPDVAAKKHLSTTVQAAAPPDQQKKKPQGAKKRQSAPAGLEACDVPAAKRGAVVDGKKRLGDVISEAEQQLQGGSTLAKQGDEVAAKEKQLLTEAVMTSSVEKLTQEGAALIGGDQLAGGEERVSALEGGKKKGQKKVAAASVGTGAAAPVIAAAAAAAAETNGADLSIQLLDGSADDAPSPSDLSQKAYGVFCGEKSGKLFLRPENSKESIMIECCCEECKLLTRSQRMMRPPQFEAHGGLGGSRRWKNSIKMRVSPQTAGLPNVLMNSGVWLASIGWESGKGFLDPVMVHPALTQEEAKAAVKAKSAAAARKRKSAPAVMPVSEAVRLGDTPSDDAMAAMKGQTVVDTAEAYHGKDIVLEVVEGGEPIMPRKKKGKSKQGAAEGGGDAAAGLSSRLDSAADADVAVVPSSQVADEKKAEAAVQEVAASSGMNKVKPVDHQARRSAAVERAGVYRSTNQTEAAIDHILSMIDPEDPAGVRLPLHNDADNSNQSDEHHAVASISQSNNMISRFAMPLYPRAAPVSPRRPIAAFSAAGVKQQPACEATTQQHSLESPQRLMSSRSEDHEDDGASYSEFNSVDQEKLSSEEEAMACARCERTETKESLAVCLLLRLLNAGLIRSEKLQEVAISATQQEPLHANNMVPGHQRNSRPDNLEGTVGLTIDGTVVVAESNGGIEMGISDAATMGEREGQHMAGHIQGADEARNDNDETSSSSNESDSGSDSEEGEDGGSEEGESNDEDEDGGSEEGGSSDEDDDDEGADSSDSSMERSSCSSASAGSVSDSAVPADAEEDHLQLTQILKQTLPRNLQSQLDDQASQEEQRKRLERQRVDSFHEDLPRQLITARKLITKRLMQYTNYMRAKRGASLRSRDSVQFKFEDRPSFWPQSLAYSKEVVNDMGWAVAKTLHHTIIQALKRDFPEHDWIST
ncbi:hypothetical protein CEUSTIGMA_g1564.t1 [Chlamydomonas eustigma]|uniref:SAND domain-containing protein n=1 Tax=Chlamydomonas eustigma TaxID=1157962 RepID=A0A250WTH3_9CHLO|nr:hypothetical protein CEUSTIGMA_g1564.t1 [Chlamydomonas eustigma]|eukprot:GAX74115.1 hypothetical protein CEUSTIGMA_g1564.t1 [Chlamydomonas eustigma]